MAIVQINDPNQRGTGWRFGESVGEGIEMLLGHKMQQMNRQRQEQNNYEALIAGGMAPEQARGYSKASPQVLQNAFQDIFSRWSTAGIKKPDETQVVAHENEPSFQSQQPQQPSNPQADLLQKLLGNQPQQEYGKINPQQALMQALQSGPLNAEQGLVDYLKDQQLKQPLHQAQPEPMGKQQVTPGIQGLPQSIQKAPSPQMPNLAGLKPQERTAAIRAFQAAQKEEARKEQQAKRESFEEKKFNAAEQDRANKETKKYYDATLLENEEAKKSDMRLGRFEHLLEKGNLPNATAYRLFKGLSEAKFGTALPLVGPLAGLIVNPILHSVGEAGLALQRNVTATDTEEYEKLSNDFIRGAKAIFGSRITDKDIDVFMAMIPTLMATDHGKQAIIRNMKLFNEASHVKADNMKRIIKENGNKRPFNLALLVDEASEPELDRIAKEFIGGLSQEQQPDQGPIADFKRIIPSANLFGR